MRIRTITVGACLIIGLAACSESADSADGAGHTTATPEYPTLPPWSKPTTVSGERSRSRVKEPATHKDRLSPGERPPAHRVDRPGVVGRPATAWSEPT